MRIKNGFLFGWLSLQGVLKVMAADPLETWELRSPLPTPNPIRDIAYGNGLWVGVGDSGTVITSPDDGTTWALQRTGVTNANVGFSGIVFTNNLFVAVGSSGLAATSPDGTNWTLRTAGNSNNQWNAVTYGGGRYVAVGQDTAALGANNVAVSMDGTNWNTFASGLSGLGYFNDVTFAQGLFVAVGGTNSYFGGVVYTSPNGSNWTLRVTNFFMSLSGITYGNGKFVGVGNTGTVLSSDGTTWTLRTNSSAYYRIGVAYGNGVYVSVGADAPSLYADGYSYTSSDGSNWVFNYLNASETVRFANGRFAAVGAPTSPLVHLLATINFSTNGATWSNLGYIGLGGAFGVPGNVGPLLSLVYGNGQFALIPDTSSVRLTTNFVDFTSPYAAYGLRTLAFGDNQFVAVVTNYASTTFASSANSWSPSGYAYGILNALCYGNSVWIGVGKDGYIATSTDAVNWTDASSGVTNQLNAVAAGSGVFVAVGEGGVVARSPDGATWTSQTLGATIEMRAVAYAAGQFVAVGFGGKIFTSGNGTTWSARSSGTFLSLNGVCYCFGRFIAVGDGGLVLSSPDGITWSHAPMVLDKNLLAVAASPTMVAAVGEGGVFQTSSDGLAWKTSTGLGAPGAIWKVVHYNGHYIAAMDGGVGLSTGGRSWQVKYLPTTYSVLAANGLIVAAGAIDGFSRATIEVSADNGANWWQTNVVLSGNPLNGLAFGNGTYVAVGQGGKVCSSVDASNWVVRTSGTLSALNDVAFGNNAFVTVIAGSTNVLRSADGTTWTTQSTGLTGTYKSIVFRDGLFYAAGTRIATSPNGISWTDRDSPSSAFNGLDKAPNGKFAACGPGGTLLVSSNLTSWTSIYTDTLENFNGVTFGGDSFVAVGFGGLIYQSDYVTNTPVSIVASPASVSVLEGGSTTFGVQASGRSPFSYQWFKDGGLIPGATSSTLTLDNVNTADAGKYHVVVNNDIGSQTSADATLTVLVVSVTVEPSTLYAFVGDNATFTANVVGAHPLAYQWFRDYGDPILGETNATLTITNAQPDDAYHSYSVAVTLAQGQTMSDSAYVSVLSSLDDVNLYGYLGTDPSYQQVPIGSTATINAVVLAPPPVSYQWNMNGTNIVGATNAALVIPDVQLTNSGDYSYTVTFTLGTLTNVYNLSTLIVYYAEPPVVTAWRQTSPGIFRLSFTGLTNRYYTLEYATSLVPPVDWQNYDTVQLKKNPTDFNNIYIPLFGTEPNAYFRVRILPP